MMMEIDRGKIIQKNSSKKNAFFKLELAVLAALNRQDCYGYEILTILKEQTKGTFALKEGVLYPILYRLSKERMISSKTEVVNGRSRVYYHLERSGKRYMNELLKEFIEKEKLINEYLIWANCMKPSQLNEINPWHDNKPRKSREVAENPKKKPDK